MSMANPSFLKYELRKRYSERIENLSPERRERASHLAVDFLRHWVKERAPTGPIGAFAPFRGEIDLWLIFKEWMEEGKLALPRLSGDRLDFFLVKRIEELSPSLYGIMEPSSSLPKLRLEELSLVLAPALAFDNNLNRLGRGLGFYDRLLAHLPSTTPRVGVGYQEQLSETPLPIESHDFPLTDRLLF